MNKQKIEEIFIRFSKENLKPTTELNYINSFELLISVILSAQATDISVNKATKQLFKISNTPENIVKLGEENLKNYIKSIGLYKTKAANIIKTCNILINCHKSIVPSTRLELEKLPGVGRKTANVVLNTYFGELVIAVDTHIFRVAQRIGLAKGKTPLEIENQLTKKIPNKFLRDAHHWLILHGRYTCTAKKPKCSNCLIKDLCEFPNKNIA
ncbi:endonuclease III [Gammaproteobacteria bacterium]|nr:endonuclease III [Gammaproteobacteria bacterium]